MTTELSNAWIARAANLGTYGAPILSTCRVKSRTAKFVTLADSCAASGYRTRLEISDPNVQVFATQSEAREWLVAKIRAAAADLEDRAAALYRKAGSIEVAGAP